MENLVIGMKKICFIAQFPPPIHGLSKAVDTLYSSRLKDKYELSKVDITNNKKILANLLKILISNCDLYYFTISQTRGGNIRDLLIIKLLLMKKKKVVIHLHGGYYRKMLESECGKIQKYINFKLLNKTSGAIVLGKSLKKMFDGLIDDRKIYIVENCIDNQFLMNDSEFANKLVEVRNKNKFAILYLSNFIESKGYKDVLNVAKLLKDRKIDNFRFVFAGKFFKDQDEKEFCDFIVKHGLAEMVDYRGIVIGDKKKNLLKESDIFILLTRYKNEGQPISIIEAMGNGLSIVTTNYSGIPDLVDNNKNGYFVDYNNYDEIIDRLLYLFKNRDKQIDIMINNRKKIVQNFNEEKYIDKIDKIFSEVI